MVNCNPETVSTDYDTSRPALLRAAHRRGRRSRSSTPSGGERGRRALAGVIVRSAARPRSSWPTRCRTPASRSSAPAPSRSTSPRTASSCQALCERLGIPQPPGGTATHARARPASSPSDSATRCWCARPTCSAAGPWRSSTTTNRSTSAMAEMASRGHARSEGGLSAERPVLVDRFLEDAIEVDVDARPRRDRRRRHRRRDGARRGGRGPLRRLRLRAAAPDAVRRGGRAHRDARPRRSPRRSACVGLINVQYAVKDGEVFVLEANPRASRTVPFVAKATGVPLAKVAARVMVGATLAELRAEGLLRPAGRGSAHVAVKEAVLPFDRFPERRHRARPRDALHRRGHGHRPHVRHRVRQEPDRRAGTSLPDARARCSSRSPTATRPAAPRRPPLRRAGVRDRRHRGHCGGVPAPRAYRWRRWWASSPIPPPVSRRTTATGRGRPARVGRGAPGGEHAAGPRPSGRWRPHPPRRHGHAGCRASPRWRRPSPRRRASPSGGRWTPTWRRCRNTTATARCGWRSERVPPGTRRAGAGRSGSGHVGAGGAGHVAEPGGHRVGHLRPRRRGRPPRRPVGDRRGHRRSRCRPTRGRASPRRDCT